MLAWKLFRVLKNGDIAPLFINRKLRLKKDTWYDAEMHITKGFFARKGWHVTAKPLAPHLKMNLSNGERREWRRVEIEDYVEVKRPESQGGLWYIANKMKVF